MRADTRNRLLEAVHRRAAWLAQQTAPGSTTRESNMLIAMAARTLFGTVIALCGPALQREWLAVLFRRELSGNAICPVCGEREMGEDTHGMCEACHEEGLRDDSDVQQAVLLAQPNKGQVN